MKHGEIDPRDSVRLQKALIEVGGSEAVTELARIVRTYRLQVSEEAIDDLRMAAEETRTLPNA